MKKQITSDGVVFASEEELHFYHWCVESIAKNFVTAFTYQSPTFSLAKAVVELVPRVGVRGKMLAPRKQTVLRECTYTADFSVTFKSIEIAQMLGFTSTTEVIDVKPAFERSQSRASKFSVLRKWVYKDHEVLVIPIVPQQLFAQTWTPAAALVTSTGRRRSGKAVENAITIEAFCKRLGALSE
jgi:hypothetical protein